MLSDAWRKIPAHIADALRAAATHLPLASHNVRRQLSDTLLATDATPTTGGASATKISQKLARALQRRSENRGYAARMDGLGNNQNVDALIPTSDDVDLLGTCMEWQTVSSYSFRQSSHVNLQELRAVSEELKDRSRGLPVAHVEQVCFAIPKLLLVV
jgi:hypothetical protein